MRVVSVLAAIAFSVAAANAFADMPALQKRVLPDANAVVAIDVERLLKSDIAKKMEWEKKLAARDLSAAIFLPANTQRVVMSAELEMSTMTVQRQLAVAELSKPVSVSSIAISEQGLADELGGVSAVRTPAGFYFLGLANDLLGITTPPDRQAVIKMVKAQGKGASSDYLQKVNLAQAPIVMALDLTDVIPVKGVRKWLSADLSRLLLVKNVPSVDDFAATVASAKGLTLTVQADTSLRGKLVLDFGSDPSVFKEPGQAILINILSDSGMAIEDLVKWKASVAGNQYTLEGDLTPAGLRKLLSVLQTPEVPTPAEEKTASSSGTGETKDPVKPVAQDDTVVASQKYFKQISVILENIKPGPSLGDNAEWLRRDAQRISKMSLVNVDRELAEWGQMVVTNLTEASRILSLGQQKVRAAAAGVNTTYVALNREYWEPDYITKSSPEQRTAMENDAKQRQKAATDMRVASAEPASRILSETMASRGRMRLQLVEKYKADF